MNPPGKNSYNKWLRATAWLWPIISVTTLFLPFLLKRIINQSLKKKGAGQIDKISLSLIHPSLTIKGYHFEKINAWEEELLDCSAQIVQLSFKWKALWKVMLVCNAGFEELDFAFTKSNTLENGQSKKTFSERFNLPVPIVVNELSVVKGKISYTDRTHGTRVKVELNRIRAEITSLFLVATNEELPTKATLKAEMYDGVLTVRMKANLLAKTPTFDMNAEITGMDMAKMNDFFKVYGKFDVNKGRLGLFTEVAARNGKYTGYVKPLIRDLDVVGLEDKNESFANKLWERTVGTAAAIFKNQRTDQLATKIPFEGSFKPDVDVWYALIETLVNGFIHALRASIDYEININSVDENKLL